MQGYEEIFNERGKSYHLAMEKYPSSRDEEFRAVVEELRQKPKGAILDLPAGGGYLRRYLNELILYLAYDFSGEFDDNHSGRKCPGNVFFYCNNSCFIATSCCRFRDERNENAGGPELS